MKQTVAWYRNFAMHYTAETWGQKFPLNIKNGTEGLSMDEQTLYIDIRGAESHAALIEQIKDDLASWHQETSDVKIKPVQRIKNMMRIKESPYEEMDVQDAYRRLKRDNHPIVYMKGFNSDKIKEVYIVKEDDQVIGYLIKTTKDLWIPSAVVDGVKGYPTKRRAVMDIRYARKTGVSYAHA